MKTQGKSDHRVVYAGDFNSARIAQGLKYPSAASLMVLRPYF